MYTYIYTVYLHCIYKHVKLGSVERNRIDLLSSLMCKCKNAPRRLNYIHHSTYERFAVKKHCGAAGSADRDSLELSAFIPLCLNSSPIAAVREKKTPKGLIAIIGLGF